MKDQADTKTTDIFPLSRRRGRPATGKALTPAEKQKAYRERQKEKAIRATESHQVQDVVRVPTFMKIEMERLRFEVERLIKENTELNKAKEKENNSYVTENEGLQARLNAANALNKALNKENDKLNEELRKAKDGIKKMQKGIEIATRDRDMAYKEKEASMRTHTRLKAKIKRNSKYYGQDEGYAFPITITPKRPGDDYVVQGGPGGQYRLIDVNLFVYDDGKYVRIK